MTWLDPTDDPWPEPTDDPWPDPTDDPWPDPTDDPWPDPTDDPPEESSDGFWEEPADAWDTARARWPLGWRGLYPRERWLWFDQLWCDACMLRDRYGLPIRAGWWENDVQLEALSALAAWVERYDSGEWDDPPGKLAMLYDLERVSALLRDGLDPFHPERDRPSFERHLLELGCEPPQPPATA